ncbi:MAG: response regulator [Syntrophomonas sp.]
MNCKNMKLDGVVSEPAYKRQSIFEQAYTNNDENNICTLYTQDMQLSEYTVLVVEDDEFYRKTMDNLLRKLGFKVKLASNGKEAVKAALSKSYSMILMDCKMPVMDGFEAAKTIRRNEFESGKYVPIIAVTANMTEQERVRCVEAGMDGFVSKPIDLKEFVETIFHWTILFQIRTDLRTCELP